VSEEAKDFIYLSPPHMGPDERELLLAAFDSNWIAPTGPDISAFEDEFATTVGVPHAVALNSGTAGLHLALQIVGVEPGADVLVSDLTFVATANAVAYVGACPVFVDSEDRSWNMDPALLAAELERRARHNRLPAAVVVVDLYGQSADYEPIIAQCRRYEVPLIEDAAEALGASYRDRPLGAWGDLAVFSFNGNKIITTSGGGMLVSNRADWVERARHLATQAREPVAHYEHAEIGFNYRISNLLAAIGRGQLRQLTHRVEARRRINNAYRDAFRDLDGVGFMPVAPYGRPSHWLTVITLDHHEAGVTPEEMRVRLLARGIEARPAWKPMHQQPVYANAPCVGGHVSERIFSTGLCLPSGSSLTDDQQGRVIEGVRDCIAARVR
jgi:dTDP-4-amino-4,6-dideoxygalactose transaminase